MRSIKNLFENRLNLITDEVEEIQSEDEKEEGNTTTYHSTNVSFKSTTRTSHTTNPKHNNNKTTITNRKDNKYPNKTRKPINSTNLSPSSSFFNLNFSFLNTIEKRLKTFKAVREVKVIACLNPNVCSLKNNSNLNRKSLVLILFVLIYLIF